MKHTAPIVIVDDDIDDHSIIQEVVQELRISNPVLFFDSAEKVLAFLEEGSVTPFLIISDVNLSGMDGFELRKKILENSQTKYGSIPFIYWSNKASKSQIKKAYDLSAHGFFIKEAHFDDIKVSFKRIIDYWYKSEQPEL